MCTQFNATNTDGSWASAGTVLFAGNTRTKDIFLPICLNLLLERISDIALKRKGKSREVTRDQVVSQHHAATGRRIGHLRLDGLRAGR